jgi:hypothetical protein
MPLRFLCTVNFLHCRQYSDQIFISFFRSQGLKLHYACGPADCYYCVLARSQLTSIVVHCYDGVQGDPAFHTGCNKINIVY